MVDLTDQCGWIMYGRENGKRRLYVCGRYMNMSGCECENNSVDAEALLASTTALLSQEALGAGGHAALRARLQKIAKEEAGESGAASSERELSALKVQQQLIEAKIKVAGLNLTLVDEQYERDLVRANLAEFRVELQDNETRRQQLESVQNRRGTGDEDIESCLRLFDRLHGSLEDRAAHLDLIQVFKALNLRVGLKFPGGRVRNGLSACSRAEFWRLVTQVCRFRCTARTECQLRKQFPLDFRHTIFRIIFSQRNAKKPPIPRAVRYQKAATRAFRTQR